MGFLKKVEKEWRKGTDKVAAAMNDAFEKTYPEKLAKYSPMANIMGKDYQRHIFNHAFSPLGPGTFEFQATYATSRERGLSSHAALRKTYQSAAKSAAILAVIFSFGSGSAAAGGAEGGAAAGTAEGTALGTGTTGTLGTSTTNTAGLVEGWSSGYGAVSPVSEGLSTGLTSAGSSASLEVGTSGLLAQGTPLVETAGTVLGDTGTSLLAQRGGEEVLKKGTESALSAWLKSTGGGLTIATVGQGIAKGFEEGPESVADIQKRNKWDGQRDSTFAPSIERRTDTVRPLTTEEYLAAGGFKEQPKKKQAKGLLEG